MSGESSSAAGWWSRLEPVGPPDHLPRRPDDPRLGECTTFHPGGPLAFRPGQPVLIGFPQDEGVRRNGGRVGAADAPTSIRRWLYRLTSWDGLTGADLVTRNLLDLGDLRRDADLEASQEALGEVVAAVLVAGAIPVVLGGGHETAYGTFLGHVRAGLPVAIVNLDAHLDVRPLIDGKGHSGSPFRQALEHPATPLRGDRYVVVGAQPFAVSREHAGYLRHRGGRIRWQAEVANQLADEMVAEVNHLAGDGCLVHVSLDADVVRQADVPGVSAPNPAGLDGIEVLRGLRKLGEIGSVPSFEVVEINPQLDRDDQSVRWAALAVWHFLCGLSRRGD